MMWMAVALWGCDDEPVAAADEPAARSARWGDLRVRGNIDWRPPPAFADVDGDGVAEVIVGDPSANGYVGGVRVLQGPLSGPVALTSGDWLPGERLGTGRAVVSLGDPDGDGFDEVLVSDGTGATLISDIDGLLRVRGVRIDVERWRWGALDLDGDGALGPAGVGGGAFVAWTDTPETDGAPPDVSVGAAAEAFASAGDVDGDGIDDLLLGCPDDPLAGEDASQRREAGVVYLVPGPLAGSTLAEDGAVALLYGEPWDELGWHLAGGDLDGDGYSDVVVGAPGSGPFLNGNLYGVYGPVRGWVSTAAEADLRITTAEAGAAVGQATIGDGDGDGVADLWVSAPGADAGGRDAGLTCGFAAPLGALDLTDADACVAGASPGDNVTLAYTLDLDGDGVHDRVWTSFSLWSAASELGVDLGAAW